MKKNVIITAFLFSIFPLCTQASFNSNTNAPTSPGKGLWAGWLDSINIFSTNNLIKLSKNAVNLFVLKPAKLAWYLTPDVVKKGAAAGLILQSGWNIYNQNGILPGLSKSFGQFFHYLQPVVTGAHGGMNYIANAIVKDGCDISQDAYGLTLDNYFKPYLPSYGRCAVNTTINFANLITANPSTVIAAVLGIKGLFMLADIIPSWSYDWISPTLKGAIYSPKKQVTSVTSEERILKMIEELTQQLKTQQRNVPPQQMKTQQRNVPPQQMKTQQRNVPPQPHAKAPTPTKQSYWEKFFSDESLKETEKAQADKMQREEALQRKKDKAFRKDQRRARHSDLVQKTESPIKVFKTKD